MKYTKEFKEEAIKLSDEIGLKKATTELGLKYYTISDWRKDRKANEKKIAILEPNELATNEEAIYANIIIKKSFILIIKLLLCQKVKIIKKSLALLPSCIVYNGIKIIFLNFLA